MAKKGKIFLLLVLYLLFQIFAAAAAAASASADDDDDCNSSSNQEQPNLELNESLTLLDLQQTQLKKLESLVENLTQVVARLESSLLPDHGKVVSEVKVSPTKVKVNFGGDANEDDGSKIGTAEGERLRGGASVTKYNPAWSERFQFSSAVKLDSEATCINVLPFEDYEGFSKYIAVGDEHGRIYIFLANGDVLVEFHTSSESPVTSMLSYMSVHKNESVLVTGHGDGVVLLHQVWEVSNGEDWHSLSMENLHSFPAIDKGEEPSSAISILEVHQVGRMRYILASDVSGNIRVLRENGTVYGSATSKGRPLAFLKQRLLFLTDSGAGSLDLRSMKIRESECEGMNHSHARNYVFDVVEGSKAYGFTSEGDLIHVVLMGDVMNFKCRVRSKRKFEIDGPLLFQAIKGYLLVVSEDKVIVYNISTQHYIRVGAPRPLFYASLDEIRSSFLNLHGSQEPPKSRGVKPLITTDREKLIVLGLGSGYVGIYRSNLPVFITEFNRFLWASPVLVFLLFLFGVWHLFGKKKDSLTAWGSEDPFSSTSVATSTLIGSSGERPFTDSSSTSRTTDLRDLRGGAVRGPSRRYTSPTRYTGGAAMPYRQNPSEASFRPSSTDHNFRPSSEMKYRGSGLDTTGFAKRREPLFPGTQAAEDNLDNIN